MHRRIVTLRVFCFKQDALVVKQHCRKVFGPVEMFLVDYTPSGSLDEQEGNRYWLFSRDLDTIPDEFEPQLEVRMSEFEEMVRQVRHHPAVWSVEYSFDGPKVY